MANEDKRGGAIPPEEEVEHKMRALNETEIAAQREQFNCVRIWYSEKVVQVKRNYDNVLSRI